MGDLISRSALIKRIKKFEEEVHQISECYVSEDEILEVLDYVEILIDEQPTVEAEPVVHCKDCKHWGMGVAGETDHVKCCEYGEYMVGANGYCVYGAKMDGGCKE